jgi:polysaccharide deacetylase family protein (PEP-CTERM system associated)
MLERPLSLPPFLFSVDLEDIRQLVPHGTRLRDRVEITTRPLLDLLRRHGGVGTFFVTGDVAHRYPELVAEIAADGHEIACHSYAHQPLDRLDATRLREDLERCRKAYSRAGVEHVVGFRAPLGSMTERTRWAYEVLRDMGFEYSSSVLAARSPIYGWPEFGGDEPRRQDGMWEIPASLTTLPGLHIPFVSGVYLRVLPWLLIRRAFRRRLASQRPVTSYIHPYDLDTEQERIRFPEIQESRVLNRLMYYNRGQVIPRFERLFRMGAPLKRYVDFVREREASGA